MSLNAFYNILSCIIYNIYFICILIYFVFFATIRIGIQTILFIMTKTMINDWTTTNCECILYLYVFSCSWSHPNQHRTAALSSVKICSGSASHRIQSKRFAKIRSVERVALQPEYLYILIWTMQSRAIQKYTKND